MIGRPQPLGVLPLPAGWLVLPAPALADPAGAGVRDLLLAGGLPGALDALVAAERAAAGPSPVLAALLLGQQAALLQQVNVSAAVGSRLVTRSGAGSGGTRRRPQALGWSTPDHPVSRTLDAALPRNIVVAGATTMLRTVLRPVRRVGPDRGRVHGLTARPDRGRFPPAATLHELRPGARGMTSVSPLRRRSRHGPHAA